MRNFPPGNAARAALAIAVAAPNVGHASNETNIERSNDNMVTGASTESL